MVATGAAGDEPFLAMVDDFIGYGVEGFGQNFSDDSVVAVGNRNGTSICYDVGPFFGEKMGNTPIKASWGRFASGKPFDAT